MSPLVVKGKREYYGRIDKILGKALDNHNVTNGVNVANVSINLIGGFPLPKPHMILDIQGIDVHFAPSTIERPVLYAVNSMGTVGDVWHAISLGITSG